MTPEEKLQGMLKQAGLPVRPSYCRAEVCLILGINKRTFWRMTAKYEPEETGHNLPSMLDSYMLRGHRRVRYDELVDYLRRNRSYERQNAADPRQLSLL